MGYVSHSCVKCRRNIVSPQYVEVAPHLVLEGGKQFPDFLQFCGAGDRLLIVSEKALDFFVKGKLSGFSVSEQCLIDCALRNDVLNTIPIYYRLNVHGRVDLNLNAMHLR